jgi:hypothetical protein
MNVDVPSGSGRAVPATRTRLTPAEARQLRQLYEQLSDAAAVAADALTDARTAWGGQAFVWFKKLDGRVTTLAARIRQVVD